jgi:CRP-like cAMP-binding protein
MANLSETSTDPMRKGMLSAGVACRGEDDLELAAKLAAIVLTSPMIRRLNSEVLRYVSRASSLLRFDAGETMAEPGRREHGLLVILRGHVAVESGNEARALETFGPGELCAAEPLVADAPALGRLRAETAVETLAIPYGVARILLARDRTLEELIHRRVSSSNLAVLLQVSDCIRTDSPTETIEVLSERAAFITVPERVCILSDGEVSDSVFLLVEGAVDVSVPHPRLGFEDVRRDQRGALLGRCSLLGINERAQTWTASDSQLLRIPRATLEGLVRYGGVEVLIPRPRPLERQAA